MRTLSQICKDADDAESVQVCMKLSDFLYDNRASYKKHEVVFGLEHIKEKAQIIEDRMKLNHLLKS